MASTLLRQARITLSAANVDVLGLDASGTPTISIVICPKRPSATMVCLFWVVSGSTVSSTILLQRTMDILSELQLAKFYSPTLVALSNQYSFPL